MDKRWICVRMDARGLWTADLCEGNTVVKNIGGSYPKYNSIVIDAKRTWVGLELKIIPNGVEEVDYKGEV